MESFLAFTPILSQDNLLVRSGMYSSGFFFFTYTVICFINLSASVSISL